MGRGDNEAEPDISWGGPVPVYEQVAAILRRRIQAGKPGPHERLPSESDIVGAFGVSRGTARHAIRLLRDEGWAYTRPQLGTFALPREDWPQPSWPAGLIPGERQNPGAGEGNAGSREKEREGRP